MNTAGDGRQLVYERMDEPTPTYVWYSMAGVPITDELIEWPPDLFALANVILGRSEAFRFALAPECDWPPRRLPAWAQVVREAGLQWSACVDDRSARSRICCRPSGAPSGSVPTGLWSGWRWGMTGACLRRC